MHDRQLRGAAGGQCAIAYIHVLIGRHMFASKVPLPVGGSGPHLTQTASRSVQLFCIAQSCANLTQTERRDTQTSLRATSV